MKQEMPLCHSFWLHWVSDNPQICRDVVIMEVQMSLCHKPETKSNRTHMEKNKCYNHTLHLATRFSWTKSKAARWDQTEMGRKQTQERQGRGHGSPEENTCVTNHSYQHTALLLWDGRGQRF